MAVIFIIVMAICAQSQPEYKAYRVHMVDSRDYYLLGTTWTDTLALLIDAKDYYRVRHTNGWIEVWDKKRYKIEVE